MKVNEKAKGTLKKLDRGLTRAEAAFTGAAVGALLAPNTVFASSDGAGAASNLIGTILDTIVGVVGWAGAALLVIGVFQTVMAFRNGDSNPDAMGNGIKTIIVGAVLGGFRVIFWPLIKQAML